MGLCLLSTDLEKVRERDRGGGATGLVREHRCARRLPRATLNKSHGTGKLLESFSGEEAKYLGLGPNEAKEIPCLDE